MTAAAAVFSCVELSRLIFEFDDTFTCYFQKSEFLHDLFAEIAERSFTKNGVKYIAQQLMNHWNSKGHNNNNVKYNIETKLWKVSNQPFSSDSQSNLIFHFEFVCNNKTYTSMVNKYCSDVYDDRNFAVVCVCYSVFYFSFFKMLYFIIILGKFTDIESFYYVC